MKKAVFLFCFATQALAQAPDPKEQLQQCNAVTNAVIEQRNAAQNQVAILAAEVQKLQTQLQAMQKKEEKK